MNSQTTMSTSSSSQDSSDSQGDSRLTVADILSSMANGETAITSLQYSALDGFSTGIPTRTTPTLTPTTLRNIEQTFIELQYVPPPMNHDHQAGFVPPIIRSVTPPPTSQATDNFPVTVPVKEEAPWYQCSLSSSRPSSKFAINQSRRVTSTCVGSAPGPIKNSGRHMGGRRPRDDKLSPEEEQRRTVRRERNKQAAARCRKRRLDHTNSLLTETEGLEDERHEMQKEIDELKHEKEHLEFILEAHRCMCKKLGARNGVSMNGGDMKDNSIATTTSVASITLPTPFAPSELAHKSVVRPNSLPISSNFSVPISTCMKTLNTPAPIVTSASSEIAGIPISTPSTGIFTFDSLLEGSTGLTPVSTGLTPIIPTCSSQQRNSNSDMSSPDSMNPPKLVSL